MKYVFFFEPSQSRNIKFRAELELPMFKFSSSSNFLTNIFSVRARVLSELSRTESLTSRIQTIVE